MRMAMNEYLIDVRQDKNLDFVGKIKKILQELPFLAQIKAKNRNIAVLLIAVFLVGIVLITGAVGSSNSTVVSSTDISDTEQRLAMVLSQIKGAGNVKVMISYEGGMKKVIAYDTTISNDKTTSGDKESEYVSENKSPVTINVSGTSSPLVLQELKPEIIGVIVVAEGAGNIKVRLDLTSAVQTVLNISSEKVEVFTMNN